MYVYRTNKERDAQGNVLAVVSDKRNGDEPDVVSVSKLRISLENQRKQNFLTDFLVFSRKSEYSF